jgi:hypothetical protein
MIMIITAVFFNMLIISDQYTHALFSLLSACE